ncbi:MAG: hypothetical protein SF052_14330 [Bacteroidia bacterium]|nr:hypothetical protein [Bacteroidia bacterium]
MKTILSFHNLKRILPFVLLLAGIRLVEMTRVSFQDLQKMQVMENRKDSVLNAPEIIRQQNQQIDQLNKTTNGYGKPSGDFVLYLEKICTSIGAKITTLPSHSPQPDENKPGKISETFQLQGEFAALLKVLFQIEVQDQVAQIAYLQWHKQKVLLNGKMTFFLVADVTIQR